MQPAQRVLTDKTHHLKWELPSLKLVSTSAPAPPNNQIDSKSRNSLESGIAEIQDMLLIRPQVKWVSYVVKRPDQVALLMLLHLRWLVTTKLKEQMEVTQLITRMDVDRRNERTHLKDVILMWGLKMLLSTRRSLIHSLSKTWKSSIKKAVLLHKMIPLMRSLSSITLHLTRSNQRRIRSSETRHYSLRPSAVTNMVHGVQAIKAAWSCVSSHN